MKERWYGCGLWQKCSGPWAVALSWAVWGPSNESHDDDDDDDDNDDETTTTATATANGLSVANEKVWSSTERPDARDLVRLLVHLKKGRGLDFGFYSGMNREDMKSIVVPLPSSLAIRAGYGQRETTHGRDNAVSNLHLCKPPLPPPRLPLSPSPHSFQVSPFPGKVWTS